MLQVSELLGSFGDNELCPECLDGMIKRDLAMNASMEEIVHVSCRFFAML